MACTHQHTIAFTEATSQECETCIQQGDTWVHLRMCMSCGVVGCCDSSKNKHARKHYLRHDHPVIRSIEPGEQWRYCFIDNEILTS